ncbi:porin family protein [uncultured Flavobacterium sp.]|uniref:porin family protein n=1 Tax=uncultured Flavobacterium sp. TaxID=165435 RepID=UPI0025FE4C39|nr:porin family protein [uncultured Flavobacterium sp.]
MKKLILCAVLMIAGITSSNAQIVKFGVKGGVNFANLDGGPEGIDYKNKTGFHAGAVAEIKILPNFAIQPEAMFSSQGAASDVDGVDDFDLDYISVPVMAKFYLITDRLSIEAGPQFSFLVNDSSKVVDELGNTYEGADPKSFDFAVAGGLGLNIAGGLFAQARYTVGLTEISKDADAKNAVFQVSLGYMF